jgi:hypothetical protein
MNLKPKKTGGAMRTTLLATALISLLSGCASAPKAVPPPGMTLEDAAERLEESKREYEACVKNREPGRPTCDSLERLYDQDQEIYESLAR